VDQKGEMELLKVDMEKESVQIEEQKRVIESQLIEVAYSYDHKENYSYS